MGLLGGTHGDGTFIAVGNAGNIIISSEKLDECKWVEVKDSSLLEFKNNNLHLSKLEC